MECFVGDMQSVDGLTFDDSNLVKGGEDCSGTGIELGFGYLGVTWEDLYIGGGAGRFVPPIFRRGGD